MCGIAGIVKTETVHQQEGGRFLSMLKHRGPDAEGYWFSEDSSVFLGHRRLKIIDLSDSANQPMITPDGRYVLIYNGEIVNYRSLRAKYKGPWSFVTSGDTETLLALWSEVGLEALAQCVGMFAFAVYDTKLHTLTLVRDRFGIKPLYYTNLKNEGFAFASEIPPLLHLSRKITPDKDIIRTYLETSLYELCGRTFYSGVYSVRPGYALVLDCRNKKIEEKKWYDLKDNLPDLSSASYSELVKEGESIIEKAVSDHLVADVHVGLNVSGGVDSSLLVSISKKYISDLHLFCQNYEDPYSESYWVKEIAGDSTLHLVPLTEQKIRQRIDYTIGVQAEPFGGVTVIGYDYLYASAASENVTVLLDGNGVDEVFLGYDKYYKSGEKDAFFSIDGSIGVRPDAIGDRLKRDANVLPIPDLQSSFEDPVRAMAAFDLLVDKIPRGLRFNDRMSMAQSRELRVPFLDHRLVEFGFALPRQLLLRNRMTKVLFRDIANRWIPKHVSNAPKRSVQSPQREWLMGPWRGLIEELISSESFAARGWINPNSAQNMYKEYLKGSQRNSLYLWQWINLELWARKFIDP